MNKEKIALITGATDGLGKATALGLAKLGYAVIVHGRNRQKTEAAVAEIKAQSGNDAVDFILADFSSLPEVKAMADAFRQRYNRLDVLVNNAAAMTAERRTSQDGHEVMLAVNYLALVMLTENLLELLQQTPDSRIVNLSSVSYKTAKPDFSDLEATHNFSMMRQYGNTKLYVLYYMLRLAERLKGSGVAVNAVHPGGVRTQLARDFKGPLKTVFAIMMPLFFISPEKGAETTIYVAASDEVMGVTGQYFVKKKAQPLKPIGTNPAFQKQLEHFTNNIINK